MKEGGRDRKLCELRRSEGGLGRLAEGDRVSKIFGRIKEGGKTVRGPQLIRLRIKTGEGCWLRCVLRFRCGCRFEKDYVEPIIGVSRGRGGRASGADCDRGK